MPRPRNLALCYYEVGGGRRTRSGGALYENAAEQNDSDPRTSVVDEAVGGGCPPDYAGA